MRCAVSRLHRHRGSTCACELEDEVQETLLTLQALSRSWPDDHREEMCTAELWPSLLQGFKSTVQVCTNLATPPQLLLPALRRLVTWCHHQGLLGNVSPSALCILVRMRPVSCVLEVRPSARVRVWQARRRWRRVCDRLVRMPTH